MKHSIKLLFLSSSLCFVSLGAAPRVSNGIDYFKCMPFYVDGTKTRMEMMVKAKTTLPVVVNVSIINDLYPSGKTLFEKTFTSTVLNRYDYENNFTRPSGNQIKITQIVNGGTPKEFTHLIAVAKAKTYTLNDSVTRIPSVSQFYSLYSTGQWVNNSEELVFYNFQDKYIPDFYHKIDFSNFYVDVSSPFSTTEIIVEDIIFRLTKSEIRSNGVAIKKEVMSFSLVLEEKDSHYYLKPKKQLYVNPKTQQMSDKPRSGYVKTNHYYFPRNEKQNENLYDCTISFIAFGIDRSSFVSHFKYKSLLNTFGDCHNSEYCVVNS